jgi:cytochrome c-type biogenesis protein CcmH/NrfF
MTKRRHLALICATFIGIATALIPSHLEAQKTDRAKALGTKLMCMCGCGQILTQCNHLNCPSSGPMLKELDAHVAKGEADDLIIQDFVQEYGEKVLSSPPATGFNALAWYIPGIAFVIGLGIVVVLIRMWRQRDVARLASATGVPAPPDAAASALREVQLERARQQVDRETED